MITEEALQFLADLIANNNTEWMHVNKKRYENYKKDYHNYIASILEEMKPLDKSLEPLEVKKDGLEKTLEYIYEQFDGIDTNYENLILAYEPVWAIGTGVTATNDDIKNIHNVIKEKIKKPLLYGGSVKVENVREICQIPNVDGALIGTASWKKEDFIQILENTKDL
jgi:triosephosphate isomerase